MNLKFKPPAMFVFLLFFVKVVLLKLVRHLKIYQHREFHGTTFKMVQVLHGCSYESKIVRSRSPSMT
jgi:hypothetical protein